MIGQPPAGPVRQAEKKDATRLMLLAGEDLPVAALDILIADGHVFLAEVDGEVAGLIVGSETDGALSVMCLRVLPGRRQRGLGSALLHALEERGRWAFHGACLASAPDDVARTFFFTRGYVALDPGHIPEGLKRAMPTGTLVMKRV